MQCLQGMDPAEVAQTDLLWLPRRLAVAQMTGRQRRICLQLLGTAVRSQLAASMLSAAGIVCNEACISSSGPTQAAPPSSISSPRAPCRQASHCLPSPEAGDCRLL